MSAGKVAALVVTLLSFFAVSPSSGANMSLFVGAAVFVSDGNTGLPTMVLTVEMVVCVVAVAVNGCILALIKELGTKVESDGGALLLTRSQWHRQTSPSSRSKAIEPDLQRHRGNPSHTEDDGDRDGVPVGRSVGFSVETVGAAEGDIVGRLVGGIVGDKVAKVVVDAVVWVEEDVCRGRLQRHTGQPFSSKRVGIAFGRHRHGRNTMHGVVTVLNVVAVVIEVKVETVVETIVPVSEVVVTVGSGEDVELVDVVVQIVVLSSASRVAPWPDVVVAIDSKQGGGIILSKRSNGL